MSDTPEQPPNSDPKGRTYSFGAQRGKKTKHRGMARDSYEKSQATAMLQMRMVGRSVSEIAKIFNVHSATVTKRLAMPEIHEIYRKAQEVIASRIMPAALEVMEESLVVGRDPDMAKEVIFGVGLMSKNVKIAASFAEPAEESFDDWRRRRIKESVIEGAVTEAVSETHVIPDHLRHDIEAEGSEGPSAPPSPGPSRS